MEKQDSNPKELSTLLSAFLAVIIASFVIGGAVFYWQSQALKKVKEEVKQELAKREIPTLTPTPALTPDLTPISTPALTPESALTPTPTGEYEGWLTYTNDVYNYEFKYPRGAGIEEAAREAFSLSPEEAAGGMTFEEKYTRYTGKICITINHGLGYVQISAPVNSGFAHVICGRTGRAFEGIDKSETLTIEGRTYTASGFEEQGPGEILNFHNETMVVILGDGTRIEYGSRPSETATFADYLTMKEEIIKIVESFRKI